MARPRMRRILREGLLGLRRRLHVDREVPRALRGAKEGERVEALRLEIGRIPLVQPLHRFGVREVAVPLLPFGEEDLDGLEIASFPTARRLRQEMVARAREPAQNLSGGLRVALHPDRMVL